MLNIGVDINLKINKVQYPIHFEKRNECVHCGGIDTLIFVDKFGRESNKEIHPFDHIKCKSCGRHFSILWQKDDKTGKMFPCAVDPSLKQEFVNMLRNKFINKNN